MNWIEGREYKSYSAHNSSSSSQANSFNSVKELMRNPRGRRYEGSWHKDCIHGKGRMYNDELNGFDGPFNFRNMNRVGERWEVYDGEFFNDRRNGRGKLKLSNG